MKALGICPRSGKPGLDMKNILFSLLVLACLLPLRADNWLENGDFLDGINHWHGNGKAPSDFAPSNPMDPVDPLTSKGLIVPLKDMDWTMVAQDFKGKSASGVMTVTYMVSPDLTFSTKKEDYLNMPDHIGYDAWAPFNTPPGKWIIFMSDFGSDHGSYYEVKPTLHSSDPQTFQTRIKGLTPFEDKTITLAFPPGSGMIIILKVSLTDN